MSELLNAVAGICDRALGRLGAGPTRDSVARVRRRLGDHVRVAVVGRVSSGKSTLVNALLGMRVAPTAAGECTRVVTWFRYGDVDSAQLRLRGGSVMPLRLTADRELPERLDVDVAQVEAIEVSLYNAALERMTVLDTPGLESMRGDASARTQEFVFGDSQRAVAEADALIHVMTGDVRADDRDLLARFRTLAGELDASAVNAVAVLTKIDKLGGTRDEIRAAAGQIVDRCARELGASAAAVVPVVGLLAETAEAGRLGEQRAACVRWLAGLGADERRQAVRAARRRLADAGDESAADHDGVAELLGVLDRYGVDSCVEAVQGGRTSAHSLTEHLRELSGIQPLRQLVDDTFASSGDALKATAALAALYRVKPDGDAKNRAVLTAELRQSSEQLALLPEMRWMRAMEVLHQLAAGAIALPPPLTDDVRRVALGRETWQRLGLAPSSSPTMRREAALQGAGRWREFRHDGRRTPDEQQAAHAMTLAYTALVRDATAGAT